MEEYLKYLIGVGGIGILLGVFYLISKSLETSIFVLMVIFTIVFIFIVIGKEIEKKGGNKDEKENS